MFGSDELVQYIESLIPEREPMIIEIERYAKEHRIPIMELSGIETMLHILKIIQPRSILEIGTAIGYSAIRMAKALPNTKIVTIERDQERYGQALTFIKRSQVEDQIQVVLGDALEVQKSFSKQDVFDCIFIDAAKGQYKRFFEIYSQFLSDNGVIFSDNVLFKGLVTNEEVENRRIRGLVKKLRDYNVWLMNHPQFETTIIPVGDGVAISTKR